jgi:MPBQ/MSBQ methyltransferase
MKLSYGQLKLRAMYRIWFDAEVRDAFHGDGYCNFGYWSPSTAVGYHGDRLVDRLLEMLPEAGANALANGGKLLDVACGQGGTTKRLRARFPTSNIIAINLFEDQLAAARTLVPNCTFVQMDATGLGFPDNEFDAVICVEAAFHFETREDFFKESWRVLRPGGYMLISDILMAAGAEIPQENIVTLKEYEDLLTTAGYSRPVIIRCRDETWAKFWPRMIWHQLRLGNWRGALRRYQHFRKWNKDFVDYIIVCSRKPVERQTV